MQTRALAGRILSYAGFCIGAVNTYMDTLDILHVIVIILRVTINPGKVLYL